MARTLPQLGAELVRQIETAWGEPQPDWARQRLLVVRLIAQHELTVAQIMRAAGVCRQTVFTFREKLSDKRFSGKPHKKWIPQIPECIKLVNNHIILLKTL